MINRLQFSIEIKADKTKVWKALWEDSNYRKWIAVFDEGSYAVSDGWKEGSEVLFLDPNENGIYSIIKTHKRNQFIQFVHLGSVLQGKKQEIDEQTKSWSGSTEMYTLIEGIDLLTLQVDIDVLDEHVEFMSTKFPFALQKIKENSLK